MKILALASLLCIILLPFLITGQTMDTTLNKLIDQKLVTTEQATIVQEQLKRPHIEGNWIYLAFLLRFESGLTGTDPSGFSHSMTFANGHLDQDEQQRVNMSLIDYLSKLKECDLVSESQFSKVKKMIENNAFVHVVPLISELIQQVQEDILVNPKKLKEFSSKLLKHSICTDTNNTSLNKAIDNHLIQYPIDLLRYCNKSLVVELANYSENPDDYLVKIHQETAALVPGLKFDNFTYTVSLDSAESFGKFKTYKLLTSLESKGETFKHSSHFKPYENRETSGMMKYFGKIDAQEYYQIFNKILIDIQSPYRLHVVKSRIRNNADYSKFGIIALTQQQVEALRQGETSFSPSYEDFKNRPTSISISNSISQYKKIGLLNHLPEAEINQYQSDLATSKLNDLNDVLAAFPNTILSFDAELGNLENPYSELVSEYAKISHGKFTPTSIEDNFDINKGSTCTVSFMFNNKIHIQELKIERDWIDGAFFKFMDNAMSTNDMRGKYYQLYTGDQTIRIIYLKPEQYDYLRENNLLVFPDQWNSQE